MGRDLFHCLIVPRIKRDAFHRYIENKGVGTTVRPWVWVLWLLLGPTISSIAFEWYIFVSVSHYLSESYTNIHSLSRHAPLFTQKASSRKLSSNTLSVYVSKQRHPKAKRINNRGQILRPWLTLHQLRHHLALKTVMKTVVMTKHCDPLPIPGRKHYRRVPHLEVNLMPGASRECLEQRALLLSLVDHLQPNLRVRQIPRVQNLPKTWSANSTTLSARIFRTLWMRRIS